MAHFFCKFYAPRPDFIKTMSEEEAALFKAHAEYMQSLLVEGKVIAHGPVIEPPGGYGMSLYEADDESEVAELTSRDPMIVADIGARYEIYRMLQLRYRK